MDERPNDEATTGTAGEAAAVTPTKPRRSRVAARATRTADDDALVVHDPASVDAPQITERVSADVLSISQGGVNIAEARHIDVRQGGITRAQADDISVTQGGIAMARGDRVSVEMGAIALAAGGEVRLSQGFAGSILARDVRIEQGGARTIIAGRATFERNSGTLMLIAGRVDGNVRTVLDWRGAVVFGVAFGLVAGLVRRARR